MVFELTQDYLKSVLHYNPGTGIFTWIRSKRRCWVGKQAGCVVQTHPEQSTPYRAIVVGGRSRYAHRLAFLYMTGSMPERVDHRDTNGLNNRWDNLRIATMSQNKANTPHRSDNTSGFKGVYWNKQRQKWQVQIRCQGTAYYLGLFSSIEEAVAAHRVEHRRLFGEFSRV